MNKILQKKDYKKSPLKKRPLRQAGQSLDDEINRFIDEKIGFHAFLIVLFSVIIVWEWVTWFFKIPINPLWLSIFATIIIAFSIRKILIYKKNVKRLKMARDGEKIVGESLDLLREKGYIVFHDIIGGDFNVDHVIVGQNGVFTIETKTVANHLEGKFNMMVKKLSLMDSVWIVTQ